MSRLVIELLPLPAFGFDEVLGMLLAIVGFPIVTAQLAFDDDLLTLLSQRSEALAGLTPHSHVCESSDLLAFTIAVVQNVVETAVGGKEAKLKQGPTASETSDTNSGWQL